MSRSSVLGALVTRFGSDPENVATEALAYVLTGSQPARRSFEEFLARFGGSCTGPYRLPRGGVGKSGERFGAGSVPARPAGNPRAGAMELMDEIVNGPLPRDPIERVLEEARRLANDEHAH